jgi:hypothetical protein
LLPARSSENSHHARSATEYLGVIQLSPTANFPNAIAFDFSALTPGAGRKGIFAVGAPLKNGNCLGLDKLDHLNLNLSRWYEGKMAASLPFSPHTTIVFVAALMVEPVETLAAQQLPKKCIFLYETSDYLHKGQSNSRYLPK